MSFVMAVTWMLGGPASQDVPLPETNSSPLKLGFPNRKVVFQPSIFRGYVSFRQCTDILINDQAVYKWEHPQTRETSWRIFSASW